MKLLTKRRGIGFLLVTLFLSSGIHADTMHVTEDAHIDLGNPDEANGVVPGMVFLFVCRDFKHVLLLSSSNGGVSCECPCHAGSTCSSLLQQVLSAQVRVPVDARLCVQGVDHEISPRTFLQPDGRASGRACPKEFNCRMGV